VLEDLEPRAGDAGLHRHPVLGRPRSVVSPLDDRGR
jgi:hypothetical protein